MGMLAAVCRFDLRIPGVRSLKEKRHIVKALTGSLRARFNVSVAEVDHQDLWQRTAIGVSAVAPDGHQLRRIVGEVERHVGSFPGVEPIALTVGYHAPEDDQP
jgi:uncharacterized protein YlxP (DUF503 family)